MVTIAEDIQDIIHIIYTIYYVYHGNPRPSFLEVITDVLGCKTFIFHGFGVQGYKGSLYLQYIWESYYSDLTRPHPPQKVAKEGKSSYFR